MEEGVKKLPIGASEQPRLAGESDSCACVNPKRYGSPCSDNGS